MPRRLSSLASCCLFASLIFSLASLSLRAALPATVLADLRTKAENGNAIAQYNLGLAYADPADPVADPTEAFVWLTLAAEKGSNQQALQRLTERLLPAQRAEAQKKLEVRRTAIAQAASLAASPIVPAPASSGDRSPFLTAPSSNKAPPTQVDGEITSLQTDKKQLSAELAAAWRETEAAKRASITKVAELNQQITARDQTIAALQSQLAARTASVSTPAIPDLREELSAKAQALSRAESTNEQLSRDLSTLSAEASRLRSQIASEQRARSDLAAKALAAGDSSARSSSEIQALTTSLSEARAALQGEQMAKAAVNEQLATLKQHAQSLEQRLATTQQERADSLSSLTEKSRALREENSTAQNEVQRLRADLQRTQVALEESRARPAVDVSSSETLTKQLADSESKLAVALRSYSLQREELESVRRTLADLESERANVASRLEATTTERSALAEQLAAKSVIAAEADTLRTDLQSARSELSALRSSVAELTPAANDATVLREQLRQTQQQAAAASIEINQLKTRLALLAPSPSSTLSSPTRPGSQSVSFAAPPPEALPAVASPSPKLGLPSTTSPGAADGAAPRIHVVQTGDTLSRIATRYYGDSKRWSDIVTANRELITNPDRLVVGSSLRIP